MMPVGQTKTMCVSKMYLLYTDSGGILNLFNFKRWLGFILVFVCGFSICIKLISFFLVIHTLFGDKRVLHRRKST